MEIQVPAVGESITEVIIGSWLKKEGDSVSQDEVLCELESEKTNFELRAEAKGILHISAEAGATVSVGSVIGRIASAEGGEKGVAVQAEKDTAKDTAVADNKSAADTATKGLGAHPAKGHPSPSAAKHIAEQGIDASAVKGTGPGGRITHADAVAAKPEKDPTSQTTGAPPAEAPKTEKESISQTTGAPPAEAPKPEKDPTSQTAGAPLAESAEGIRREKLSTLRRTLARRLVAVKNETAMLTTFNEVNMGAIMALRQEYKAPFKEKYEVGLGFMSFFVRAICIALHEWPAVNAHIDGQDAIYHDYCDISIAVSTPKGLVVPVVRRAESLSFDAIEKEILRLATKARDGKLSMEDMRGGTFTITNGGVFGSLMSTPILNAPQSAILGMHNIVERPVVVKGEIVVRPIMYLALSYDHRMIDGRESVSFLVRVKELLEDPTRLLLRV